MNSINIFEGEKAFTSEEQISIVIAGDFCLNHKNDYSASKKEDFVEKKLINKIKESDFSCVNFEGVIDNNLSPVSNNGPNVKTHHVAPKLIKKFGFSSVSLANNHIYDYGAAGLKETIKACEKVGLTTLGVGSSSEGAAGPTEIKLNGSTIAIFNFTSWNYYLSNLENPTIGTPKPETAILKIQKAKQKYDFIIVIDHKGKILAPLPSAQRQKHYRNYVRAGADVVVAHHPHVPQGWENFGNSIICYSLGNFLFDYDATYKFPSNYRWGTIAEINFCRYKLVSANLIPIQSSENFVTFSENTSKKINHLKNTSKIIQDEKKLKLFWTEIAHRLYNHSPPKIEYPLSFISKLKSLFISNKNFLKKHLQLLKSDSSRWLYETVFEQKLNPVDIPDKIQSKAKQLWAMTNEDYLQYYTDENLVTKILGWGRNHFYSGVIRTLTKKMGFHSFLKKFYKLLLNKFSSR